MFDNAISQTAKKALAILKRIPEIKGFYLAGGTGLALQIGHRISYDFDFFSLEKFSPERLITTLNSITDLTEVTIQENTARGFYLDCELSFFYYQYPLLEKTNLYQGIQIASIKDIGLMKLIAIGGRGVKKDFYDLYHIMKEHIPLQEILNSFDQKYNNNHLNKFHYIKSLTYFDNADNDQSKLNLIKDVSWEEVKSYISKQASKIFN